MDTIPVAQASESGRDERGRFTRNNAGGPGNPFARQVARLRQELLNCVTEDDMAAIAAKLIELARDGNLQAIKLLFSYTLGKPAEAVQPDQLDVEEWNLQKQTASMMVELPVVVAAPDPCLPLTIARAARPAVTRQVSQQLQTTLQPPAAEPDDRQARRERRRERRRCARQRRQRETSHGHNQTSGKPADYNDPQVQAALLSVGQRDERAVGSLIAIFGAAGFAQECKPRVPSPSGNGVSGDARGQAVTARAEE
jgi:hypothetical protein